MLLARRIAILLLLALWLPAALHCRLEAAGLMPDANCCTETHHDAPADSCADDACEVAEGEFTKPSSSTLAAPAPALCACLLCFTQISPPLELTPPVRAVSDLAAAPPEIARTWHFVARAAPAPRAPAESLS